MALSSSMAQDSSTLVLAPKRNSRWSMVTSRLFNKAGGP